MAKIFLKGFLIPFIFFLAMPQSILAQSQGKIKTLGIDKFHKSVIKAKRPQLLDVRTPEEFEDGHIIGSVNYNVMDSTLAQNLNKLNKKKPVYVYCKSGVRSMKAAELLKENGFRVVNLEGGITDWKSRGFPTSQSEF